MLCGLWEQGVLEEMSFVTELDESLESDDDKRDVTCGCSDIGCPLSI